MLSKAATTTATIRQISQQRTFASRKIVRDPRRGGSNKQQITSTLESSGNQKNYDGNGNDNNKSLSLPLPFDPTTTAQTSSLTNRMSCSNQQSSSSLGASLGSYMLAGAGMALGFTFVGLIFGLIFG